MASGEMFTILAVLEASDRMSSVLERIDGALDQFSDTAARTAAVAEGAGKAIDDSLLQTASGADAVELANARLAAAQAKATAATSEQAAAEEELLQVQRKIAAGEMDAVEAADKQAAAASRLAAAERDSAAASREAATAAKLQADTADAAAAETDTAAATQKRFSGAMAASSGAMATVTKVGIVAGAAVAAIGYESVKAATKFQTLTTRLVTSAGESASNLDLVRRGILAVSDTTGSSADQLAEAMYTVESAGYHGAAGLNVLKAATEGAKDEGADFATVSNGVTDALKDFHMGADQSATVTSQLVKAVSFGKTTFQQFSKALSNVLPLAGAIHLKLADVSGMLAEMTSHGVTAQRASQNIANAMRSLENPTAVMTKEFKAVGINAQDVQKHLAKQGLGGTMEWLSGLAHDNATKLGQTYPAALAKLMGTSAGLNVALMTTGENAGDTSKAIAGIAGASADASGDVEGFNKIQDTLGFKMDQAKTAIHNTGIAIGTALLPLVTELMGAVDRILVPIANWTSKHEHLIALILVSVGAMASAAGAIKLVSVAMGILDAVMDANPIGLVIIAIAGLVAGVIYAWNHFKGFRDVVMDVWNAIKTVVAVNIALIVGYFHLMVAAGEWVWHALQAAWDGTVSGVEGLWHDIESIWNSIWSVTTTVWNAISGFFEKWWPLLLVIFAPPIAALIAIWNHFHSDIENTVKAVWNKVSGFLRSVWDELHAAGVATWLLIRLAVINPTEALWHDLESLWHAASSWLSGQWHSIEAQASAIWNAIKTAISNPLEAAWHSVEDVGGRIESAISSRLHAAWNQVKAVGSWFESVGEDIVHGIVSGVESAGSSLMSSLKGLANDALKSAKSALGINSPSRVFRDEVGQSLPEGIAAGVTRYAHLAHKAVTDLTGSLTGTAHTAVTGSLSWASGSLPALSAGSAGGVVNVTVDLRGSHIMSDADTNALVNKIGRAVATKLLPQGGVRIAM